MPTFFGARGTASTGDGGGARGIDGGWTRDISTGVFLVKTLLISSRL